MRSRSLALSAVFFLFASSLFAMGPRLRTHQDAPALPLPAPFALRGDMVRPQQWYRVAEGLSNPGRETVALPLSAGLALFSVPVRTDSQMLSDILQNLPAGSRVWTWDALGQQFVEGFDQPLTFGGGALLYVPSPTIVTVTGTPDNSEQVPVNLEAGWNLVGVPAETPFARASQNVYAGGISMQFNDAVNSGDLGPDVFSLDSRGQKSVTEDDSFEPMNAYWMYSNDAELLELTTQPPLLQAGEAETVGTWDGAKAGLTLLQFAASQYLAKLNREATAAQMQDILDQINYVQRTQLIIVNEVTKLNDTINYAKSELLATIKEQPIQTIQAAIVSKYDGGATPGVPPEEDSFMWLATNADSKNITDEEKLAFDLSILSNDDSDWRRKFTAINGAVIGTGEAAGIFDNYANLVILNDPSNSTNYMQNRYRRMEEFFKQIIGMQVKCMLMITNAFNDIYQNPAYTGSVRYSDQSAQNWYTGTYLPLMKAEVNRYRSAVDRVIAGTLLNGRNAEEPAVRVPALVRDVIAPSTDWMVMALLGEPGGLRMRVLVSPDMNPNNYYTVGGFPFQLPSTDSGPSNWTRIAGNTVYDSWQIDPPTSKPKFFATNQWLMYRNLNFFIPGPIPGMNPRYIGYNYAVGDKFRLTDTRNPSNSYSRINYGYVDENGKYADTTGTLFGSVVLATRASANSMLNFPAGNIRGCGKSTMNFIGVTNCNVYSGFNVNKNVDFISGNASTGNLEMRINSIRSGRATGNNYMQVLDGGSSMNYLSSSGTETVTSPPRLIQWGANKTYTLQIGVNYGQQCDYIPGNGGRPGYNDCVVPASQSVTRDKVTMQFTGSPSP